MGNIIWESLQGVLGLLRPIPDVHLRLAGTRQALASGDAISLGVDPVTWQGATWAKGAERAVCQATSVVQSQPLTLSLFSHVLVCFGARSQK